MYIWGFGAVTKIKGGEAVSGLELKELLSNSILLITKDVGH